jgi:hypothetical protein
MKAERIGILGGAALAAGLLLGTAGAVLAQGPTPSSTAGPGVGGSGLMAGVGGSGMMAGVGGSGMNAIHDAMIANGACDPSKMQPLHGSPASTGEPASGRGATFQG